MTNDRTPHLFFAGTAPRVYSLVAPVATEAARGTTGYGEFVLEHRKDGDSLVMFLTVEGEDSAQRPLPVSTGGTDTLRGIGHVTSGETWGRPTRPNHHQHRQRPGNGLSRHARTGHLT